MYSIEFLTQKCPVPHLKFVWPTSVCWDYCTYSTHDAHSLPHLTAQKDLLYIAFWIVFGCEEEEVGTCLGNRKQEEVGEYGVE